MLSVLLNLGLFCGPFIIKFFFFIIMHVVGFSVGQQIACYYGIMEKMGKYHFQKKKKISILLNFLN